MSGAKLISGVCRFDSDQLRGYMKKLLASTLQGMVWDPKDRDKSKAWCKEIGERVKDRMLGKFTSLTRPGYLTLMRAQTIEIEPNGL